LAVAYSTETSLRPGADKRTTRSTNPSPSPTTTSAGPRIAGVATAAGVAAPLKTSVAVNAMHKHNQYFIGSTPHRIVFCVDGGESTRRAGHSRPKGPDRP
jgi:hypothetical protein